MSVKDLFETAKAGQLLRYGDKHFPSHLEFFEFIVGGKHYVNLQTPEGVVPFTYCQWAYITLENAEVVDNPELEKSYFLETDFDDSKIGAVLLDEHPALERFYGKRVSIEIKEEQKEEH